jgi:hypothetical protein
MKASLVVMMIVPGNCANFVHPKPTELTQQNHEQLDTLPDDDDGDIDQTNPLRPQDSICFLPFYPHYSRTSSS